MICTDYGHGIQIVIVRTLRFVALAAAGIAFLVYGIGFLRTPVAADAPERTGALFKTFGSAGLALVSMGVGALLFMGGGWGAVHEIRKARPRSIAPPEQFTEITLHLREKRQNTGAFEHVVIFDAHLRLSSSNSGIEIILAPDVSQPDAPAQLQDDEKQALHYIRSGAEAVLGPLGLGAHITVSNLQIHPVDFVASRFQVYTERELGKVLASYKTADRTE